MLLVVVTPPVGGLTDTEGLREMGHWLDIPADVGSADAVVIMGGDSRRLAPGVALYQEGYAPEVWYTGSDVPSQRALRQIIRLGVPPAVTTHLEGSNTWEETQQIADTLTARDLHSVVIVTSWYHGRRAICTLRRHLQLLGDADSVTIYYQPVGYDAYGPDDWWISEAGRKAIFAELAKIGFYWFNYGLVLQGC